MNQNSLLSNLRSIHLPIYLKLLIALVAVIFLVFSFQSYRGASKAVQKLNETYLSDDSTINIASRNDELFALMRRQGLLQASLRLAEYDSIGLNINLVDSTVSLELKGVEVFGSKIAGFSSSRIFSKMDRASLITLLSVPLSITADTSNILKEPIRTVKAPKNEEEAAQMVSQNVPDTIQEYVVIRLALDNNIIVMIEQAPDSIPKNAHEYHEFLSGIENKRTMDMWRNLITFKAPEYQPWIKIYLPPDEAKSIYRALPSNGKAVLKI